MSFSFVTSYPWWFLLLCPLAGILAAGILYFKPFRKDPETRKLTVSLFALRASAVTLLVFLLLGPFIRTQTKEVEKPVLVIAQDNSESIVIGRDSAYYRTDYKKQVEDFIAKLSEEYDVQAYSFGSTLKEGIEWKYNDKETDFSTLFSELEARYSNRNLGAVIIATDGIYNKGTNPVFSAANLKAPFFTVALGDTNPGKDLFISRVAANKIAFLGNTFPVQIFVDARKCQGKTSLLTVTKNGKKLYSTEVRIDRELFSRAFNLQLDASETGMQRYNISLQPVDGEISIKNNVSNIFVDVLDSREKVLIMGKAPHPDLGAIKMAIENSQTYQADIIIADEGKPVFKKYNLLILHSIPYPGAQSKAMLDEIKASGLPVLFITSNSTDWNLLSGAGTGVALSDFKEKYNDALPFVNRGFSQFQLSNELVSRINKFPPLTSPFGNYKTSAGVNVLAFQKIGMVETPNPLIAFTESNGVRTGLISGEGIWRWRLADFAMNGNQDAFNELISKVIQFLSTRVNKSQFRVNSKNSFTENEIIEFDAELYNESFEPVNEDEVALVISNEEGKKFPYVFSKTSTAYHLNAGLFPPGEYRYDATVKGKKHKASGKFIITPLIAEQTNTVADHLLLNNLAVSKGGKMYHPSRLDSLYDEITRRKDITSVSYVQTSMKEIIDVKWLFALALLLLAIEWFIRKYNGLY